MNPDVDQELLFEEAMQAEPLPGRREELNRLLVTNPNLQATWIAHRRLVVHFSGHAPRTDLGARVLAVIQSGRQSRCHTIAVGVGQRLAFRRRKQIWLSTIVAVAAIVLVGVAISWPQPDVELQRAGVEGSQRIACGTTLAFDGQVALRWRDGSQAELAPGSHVTVDKDGLNLVTGVADCTIQPRGRDPFRITTAHGEVNVLGTRFRCSADTTSSGVSVSQGRVQLISADTKLELSAGDAARAFARSPMQRENVVWRWPGDDALLTIGTRTVDGIVSSGIYQDQDWSIPFINVAHVAGGKKLFAWHPSQFLRVALRSADRQMHLQCFDETLKMNHHFLATVVPGEWTVVTFDLDDLRPYGNGARLVTGESIGHVNFTPGQDPVGHPFELGWIEIVQTQLH